MRRDRLRRAVRFGMLPIAVLLAAEAAVRVILPPPLPWRQPQLRFRPDPHLIFSLVPDQVAFSADKSVPINRDGLRGQVVSGQPGEESLRVLVLGDSVAFGLGVADGDVVDDRTAVHLARAGIEAEVINGAVPCYNLNQSAAFLERECRRYQPDWVVVLISWDDFADKSGVRVSEDGRLISAGESRPRGDGWATSKPVYVLRNALKRSRLLYAPRRLFAGEEDVARRRQDILAGRSNQEIEEGWRRFDRAAALLARLSAQCDFRLLLVALPFRTALEATYPESSYPARVRATAQAHRLALIDLESTFRQAPTDPASFFLPYDEDHLNAAGHELVARAVSGYLIDRETNVEVRQPGTSMRTVAHEAL